MSARPGYLLLWLGSASDDSSNTPLATIFQYPVVVDAACMHDMVGVSVAVQVCCRAARAYVRFALSISYLHDVEKPVTQQSTKYNKGRRMQGQRTKRLVRMTENISRRSCTPLLDEQSQKPSFTSYLPYLSTDGIVFFSFIPFSSDFTRCHEIEISQKS